ncbi:MAG: sigma-70 family RNA polymerase sigma factor [bacterium]|nr:sigma-70 family RNA polymerase sigma factor [bacterium]
MEGSARRRSMPPTVMGRRARDVAPLAPTIDLIRRFQAGDRSALDALFERYYERVRRCVRIRLAPAVRARVDEEDVLQDAFVRSITGLETYEQRGDSELIHWWSRLVRNLVVNLDQHHRSAGRDVGRECPDREGLATARTTSIGSQAAARETADRIDACLDELASDQREVIVLRLYEGGSWEAVAEAMGRPSPAAARQLFERAKDKLRPLLARCVDGR